MTEAPPAAESKPPRKSRFWRWLKRGFLVLFGLLILAVVFHRQLLQWGLNWGATHFAQRQGFTLEWELEGSMLSDLKVRALKVRGPENSTVVNIDMKDALLRYNLWKLWREGPGGFLEEIRLSGATIEADIRTRIDTPVPPPRVKRNKPPPDIWVNRINLQNVNALIHTDEGDIVLKGLNLLIDEHEPGSLRIEEFVLPSANLHVYDVEGRTMVKDRRLSIANLRLDPNVTVPLLYVDVKDLHQGAMEYQLDVQSGKGTFSSKGRVEGVGTEPAVNSTVRITNMAHTEVARWTKLPEGFATTVVLADIKVKGRPQWPRQLDAEVVLQVSGVRVAGYACDTAELLGTIKDGTLNVGSFKIASGPNLLESQGTVKLPESWKQFSKSDMQVQWSIAAPDLSTVKQAGVALQGSLNGKGTVALVEGKVREATAKLDGVGIKLPQAEVPSLKVDITSNDAVVRINEFLATLDEQGTNRVHATGEMVLSGRQPTQLQVDGSVTNIAGLFRILKLTNTPPPEAGRAEVKVISAFDLMDLREKNFNRATAQAFLQVNALKWRNGDLQALMTDVSLRDGIATVTANLNHQGTNTATLKSTLQISGRQPVKVEWTAQLGDLASLLPLAGVQLSPPPQAGAVNSKGSATFELADLREKQYQKVAAEGEVQLTKLAWREGKLDFFQSQFSIANGLLRASSRLEHEGKNTANVDADMQLTGRQTTALKWDVKLNELTTLGPLMGMSPAPTAGTVVSQGTASFDVADLKEKQYARPVAKGELAVAGLKWRGGTVENLDLAFTVQQGIADITSGLVRFDRDNHITIEGRVPLNTEQPFSAEVHAQLPRLTALAPWLGAKSPKIAAGGAVIDWKGSGVIATRNITGGGTVAVNAVRVEGRTETYDLFLNTKHEGKRAEITELRASAGEFRLEAQATVTDTDLSVPRLTLSTQRVQLLNGTMQLPLALARQPRPAVPLDDARPMHLQFKMERLNLQQVFDTIGKTAPVEGTVTGEVSFEGTLKELQGKVTASLSGVRSRTLQGKLQPAQADIALVLARDRLTLDTTVRQPPLQPLTVAGSMELDAEMLLRNPKALMERPFQAHVSLPASSLDVVPRFVPKLQRLDGTIALEADITGTPAKPTWSGELRTVVNSVALRNVPMDIKDVKANLDFRETRVELNDVSAMVAGGRIRLGGRVDAANIKDPIMDLRLTADQALIVRDNTMSFRANADVSCRGTLAKSAVGGRVELVRGRIFKEVEFLPLSLPNQLPPLPPSVRTGRGVIAAPAMLKDWTFDVAVTTRDPVRLLGNIMNGGMLVNAHIGGTGAALAVDGRATMDGVRLMLPFSRLTITHGVLIFNKDNPFDPSLDVRGESLVNNYRVTVFANGSARAPQLSFTSSPPLPENEIASLLATGSTAGDPGGAEGMAANRAAFLLVSQMYRKLFNKAAPRRRFDEEPSRITFTVDPLGSTGRSGTGPGVTARIELSDKLQATGSVGGEGFRGLLYYLVRLR